MKKSIVFIAACIALTACHKKPQDLIIGKWKASDGSFADGVMNFNDKGIGSVQNGLDTSNTQAFGYKLSDDGKQILVYPPDKIPASFKEDKDLGQELADIV